MKITEVTILNEDLGNLNKLNAPKLVSVFKQEGYQRSRGGYKLNHNGKKLTTFHTINNTSELVDIGPIKSISDVRKAYKAQSDMAVAFALKIGETTVLIARFNEHDLAGRSREGAVAWDLSKFAEQLNSHYDELNKGKMYGKLSPEVDSFRTRKTQHYDYDRNYNRVEPPIEIVDKFTGLARNTENLGKKILEIKAVADAVKQPLTLTLILRDKIGMEKRNQRSKIRQELGNLGDDLKTRLAKFKNSKRPTAQSITDFIKVAAEKSAGIIQFDGTAWHIAKSGNLSMSVNDLFNGKPFKVEYRSAEPGESYNTLDILYTYSKTNQTLEPLYAEYSKKDPDKGLFSGKYTEVIDYPAYAKRVMKISDPNSKEEMLRFILEMFKNGGTYNYPKVRTYIRVCRGLGNDWPELAMIEKSMAAELAKKNPD